MPNTALLTPATLTLIDLALEEDLGRGDVTSDAVLEPHQTVEAWMTARERLIIAGLPIAAEVWRRVSPAIKVETLAQDGAVILPGAHVARIQGPAHAVLRGERTALNFVQRMSGIATGTHAYVEAVTGTRARVADTRKTTPGWRLLEKYAVRMGGGCNHRFDLGSGVLIKDNHIAVAGGVRTAIDRARKNAPHTLRVEVEVDTLAQFDEALSAGADVVLLDNFKTAEIQEAVRRAEARHPRPLLEVSGGVTLPRLRELANTGVDVISIGALTHSVRAVDLGLDVHG